tara:strand:+ start:2109 stop:3023 length:915 start_codon:yes stop_codon:yes gene_type:complete
MPQERAGKPDAWSDKLWKTYKLFGESDKKYVQSCNRFLVEMCESHLTAMVDLNLKLMYVMVRNGDIPMPEWFDITTGLPSLLDIGDAEDEVGIYRDWYKKHIRWPEECVAEKETPMIGGARYDVFSPWLLTACRELAIRSVEKTLNTDIDTYVSDSGKLMLKANQDMLEYLKSGAWRIDEEAPIEELDIKMQRHPEESRRDYINRVKLIVDDYLMYGMLQASMIRRHPSVPLQGRPLDPDHLHEKMLVMRMFGATNREIVDACENALLDNKGRPLSDPRKTVYNRTGLIAEHLGFLPISGDEEA